MNIHTCTLLTDKEVCSCLFIKFEAWNQTQQLTTNICISTYKIALSEVAGGHCHCTATPWSITMNSGRSPHSCHTMAEWGGWREVVAAVPACAASSWTDV